MTITSDSAGQVFQSRVDGWVAEAIAGGASTFGTLLSSLPGVFPTIALEAVHRLRQSGRVDRTAAEALENQARVARRTPSGTDDRLPPPHPLEFEWRFTQATAREMLSLAASFASRDDRVMLFGTPSLAAMAAASPITPQTIFVGENNAVTRSIAAIECVATSALEIRDLSGPRIHCGGSRGHRGRSALVLRLHSAHACDCRIGLPSRWLRSRQPPVRGHEAERAGGSPENASLS